MAEEIHPLSKFLDKIEDGNALSAYDFRNICRPIVDICINNIETNNVNSEGKEPTVEMVVTEEKGYNLLFKNIKGNKGDKGDPNILSIGDVSSAEKAAATITGESPNQILNLVMEKGEKGDPNVLTIGNVSYGDKASASITGTAPNQTLNLVLPRGEQGVPGTTGELGTFTFVASGTKLGSGNPLYPDMIEFTIPTHIPLSDSSYAMVVPLSLAQQSNWSSNLHCNAAYINVSDRKVYLYSKYNSAIDYANTKFIIVT